MCLLVQSYLTNFKEEDLLLETMKQQFAEVEQILIVLQIYRKVMEVCARGTETGE